MVNDGKGPGVSFSVSAIINPILKITNETIFTIKEKLSKATADAIISEETIIKTANMLERAKKVLNRDTSGMEEGSGKTVAKAMNTISAGEDKVATEGLKIMKKSLGFVEEIHQKLVQSSPLLKTIESLFNLAVQLFFMPLGNKLAEVMIPAVIDLVEQVTALWGSFEGKTLGEILDTMVAQGARIFGNYFIDLGKQLAGQGTWLGSIANILVNIGNFIQGPGMALLQLGVGLVDFILRHFKEIISIVVAFKVASLANQVATMFVIATSSTLAGKVGAGLAVAAGAAAGLATYGYVDTHSNFGVNYDEVAQPIVGYTSSSSNKTTNITNNFNGITDSNFKKEVIGILNEQNNNYKLRSTF